MDAVQVPQNSCIVDLQYRVSCQILKRRMKRINTKTFCKLLWNNLQQKRQKYWLMFGARLAAKWLFKFKIAFYSDTNFSFIHVSHQNVTTNYLYFSQVYKCAGFYLPGTIFEKNKQFPTSHDLRKKVYIFHTFFQIKIVLNC